MRVSPSSRTRFPVASNPVKRVGCGPCPALNDTAVRGLLEPANYAVVSTLNPDGSIHSTIVWISLEGGVFAVNSAQGRKWSNNLERDPRVTVAVFPADNPYEYVEIRGTAERHARGRRRSHQPPGQKYINRTSIRSAPPARSG